MPDNWAPIRLGDVCTKIGSGATPHGGSNVYLQKGEITLIRSQNVHNEGFRRDGLVFITPEQAQDLDQVKVIQGDVLLNITGDSVARCCQVRCASSAITMTLRRSESSGYRSPFASGWNF
jgi:type I restriction enzyme S subunit